MSGERDYILGTHDAEIERLGLQHAVWRRQALDGWIYAGFTTGQTIVDAGCGPGYAALDLSEIVGPRGRVVAAERSRRFLEALKASAERRNIRNIDAIEVDLDTDPLPGVRADGVWVRWVLAFVKRPREVLAKIRSLLRPGGALVVHEYFDYSTWRLAPRSELFESFVAEVTASWRAAGGEPDIALQLPQWLSEDGFQIRRLRPIIDIVGPSDFIWQWPAAFVHAGLDRLVDLGRMSRERAQSVRDDFVERENSGARMITPAVMEIVATAT